MYGRFPPSTHILLLLSVIKGTIGGGGGGGGGGVRHFQLFLVYLENKYVKFTETSVFWTPKHSFSALQNFSWRACLSPLKLRIRFALIARRHTSEE